MQLAAKPKTAKDVKAKEVVEKKPTSAAKKADKQQRLIITAKARATKAAAKAEDLCLKLAHAMALQDVRKADPPPPSDMFHLHKKSKDLLGASSIVLTSTCSLFQSPQCKLLAENK
jgi:hypothetical protein